jgi:hypothetical protein
MFSLAGRQGLASVEAGIVALSHFAGQTTLARHGSKTHTLKLDPYPPAEMSYLVYTAVNAEFSTLCIHGPANLTGVIVQYQNRSDAVPVWAHAGECAHAGVPTGA